MATSKNNIWIVSNGKESNLDLKSITNLKVSGPVTEYKMSEIAMYLLNPVPIEMEDYVIGCKIQYKVPASGVFKRFGHKLKFWKTDSANNGEEFSEEILLKTKHNPPIFKDDSLSQHFTRMKEQLLPFKPIQKKLSSLDLSQVEEITAIGEGIDKSQYQISLNGTLSDKVNFILTSITNKAKMTLKKSYIQNGLFDFRGYSFSTYKPGNGYPLIKCFSNDQVKYCVLTADYKFNYWVEDIALIRYLHLFEQSLQNDTHLSDAIHLCIQGRANALKLYFSNKLEQSYSKRYLPKIYREMLFAHNIAPQEIEAISDTLNSNQSIVFFTYTRTDEPDHQKLFTNISVMHDVTALDFIKEKVPQVYSEIIKKNKDIKKSKLYLLDSMRGCQDV